MNYAYLLKAILDVCEELIVSGAEVARAEDSVTRMCVSYEARRIDVSVIANNIQATLIGPDGTISTQIRSIKREGTNFDRLDLLNALSRRICEEKPTPEEIEKMLKEVMTKPEGGQGLVVLGSVMVCGAYSCFFGGSWRDLIAASIMGCLISLVLPLLQKRQDNKAALYFLISLIAGVAAILLIKAGIGVHVHNIMIAGIMIFIPGIAFTNAVRDVFVGDIATGLLRLFDSLLVAAAIAGGFALSLILLGGLL